MSLLDEVLAELEILNASQDKTVVSDVVKRYGFFPYSVWRLGNNKHLENLCGDDIATGTYKVKKMQDPEHRIKTKKSGYQPFKQGLSRFNVVMAERLVNYYTEKGDIVLTPFGSRGIITIVAAHLGRKSICVEIHPRYARHIQDVIDALNEKGSKSIFKKKYDAVCHNANANDMSMIKTDSIDCIITSPPFWNIEKYESCEGQLSDINSYEEFLGEYQKCLDECYRVMKPGGVAIFVVNDFRKPAKNGEDSKLIRFSRDTELCMEKAGFDTYDIGINFLFSTPSVIGVHRIAEMKRLLKAHEYFLVFKK